jgi:outer membrane protein
MIVRSRGLLVAALLSLVAAAPLAAQKVGFVDTRKILQEMPGRNAAEARMRAGLETLSLRQRKMVDSLNALMAAFEADSANLSQEQKVARFTALQVYDQQYRDTLQVLEEEAQEQQAAAMQPLFDIIRLALDDVRQADGYAMIFDIGAQGNNVVSMDKNLDLSDKVLARIRAMPAPTAPMVPPPAAAPQQPAPGPVSQPAGVRRP